MGNSKSKSKEKKGRTNSSEGGDGASASAAAASSSSGIRAPVSLGSESGADVREDPTPSALAGGSDFAPKESDLKSVATEEAALSFWERGKTFRPQREVPEDAKKGAAGRIMRTVQGTMKATLGGGDLQKAVKCPPGEDRNEWIAVNTVQFYNAASLIYGTVVLYCTESTCPSMAAGKAEYLWKDEGEYKKPTRVPAPKYVDMMMAEIDSQITDERIFPTEEHVPFPRNYMHVVKQIYKRLFRLYAHIYCAHSDRIRSIGASAHLNTTFKHLVFFILEHDLVSKTEMAPLERLISKFTTEANERASSAGRSRDGGSKQ